MLVATAVAVLVLVLAALVTLLARPPYRSQAQVYFGPTATLDASAQARLTSYADLVDGRDGVRATALPGSLVVRITARDADARAAQRRVGQATRLLQTRAASLEPSSRGLSASVIVEPTLPDRRGSAPWSRNLLLGLVAGLLLGLLAAALVSRRPRRLGDRDAVVEVLPTWATDAVPIAGQTAALVRVEDHEGRYDALADGLRYLDVDAEGSTLVLAPSRPGHDATEVAVRLAARLVEAGSSVVLVDAALAGPEVAGMLGLDGATGLVSVLAGESDLPDAVRRHAPTGLLVLPAGPVAPDPAALLGSRAMARLLERLRQEHSSVIVLADALAGGDAAARLAAAADGLLLVLREQRDTDTQLTGAVESLELRGARLRGVVLTRVVGTGPATAPTPTPATPPPAPELVFPTVSAEPEPEPVAVAVIPAQRRSTDDVVAPVEPATQPELQPEPSRSLLDDFLADETNDETGDETGEEPRWAEPEDTETMWRPAR